MHKSCMFLVLMVCSISLVGMEEPSDETAQQVVESSASPEIFNAARNAACSGYFKRLESILEKHSFSEQQKNFLLYHTIGSKVLGKEYIDCFALLLLHGAGVDEPADYAESRTALQLIDEAIHSKKYTELALAVRGKIVKDVLPRIAQLVRDQSVRVDSLDKFYRPRVKLLREALSTCNTLPDAARREDMRVLKIFLPQLSQSKHISARDRELQLWRALDTAISLQNTDMIDELVKYGAPIKTRLDYHFFDRLDILKHCVAKRYVTTKDLDRYATQIPKEYGIGYSSMTEAEFNAAKASANQVLTEAKKLLDAKRSLSTDESDVKMVTKEARILEKKDE